MQFKIDENLPIEIAELLTNAGHNTKTVNEQQLQGVRDPPVLIEVCKSENRVLVTLDKVKFISQISPAQTLSHLPGS